MSSETKNILVVDDDNYIRIGLERGLSLEGYEVLVAENAAQATELLHENQIDLVLLDVNMPGRSGMELLPDIVAEYPDVAVIMLTGDGDLSAAVVAMREGAYDYAVKPVGLSELAFRVESALIRREATIGSRASSDENQRLVSAFRAGLERFKHELTNLTEYQRAQVVPTEMSNPADERVSESLATLSDQINELGSIVGTSSTEDEAA